MEPLLVVGLSNLITASLCLIFCLRVGLPILHPITLFVIYYFFGYVTRPFVIYVNDYSQLWEFIGYIPEARELYFAALCTNAALLAFVFVPYIIEPRWYRECQIPASEIHLKSPSRFFLLFCLLILAGLWAINNSHAGADSMSVMGYEVDVDSKGGQRLVGTSGYATAAAEFLPASLIVLVLIYGFQFKSFVWIAPFVFVRFWIGAGRNAFLLLALGMIAIYLMRIQRRFITIRMAIFGAVSLFVFDVVGSNRLAMRMLMSGDITLPEIFADYFAKRGKDSFTSDFQEFDVSTTIFSVVPDITGYNWLSQYIRIFIWPIPRQIWDDKPVYTSLIDLSQVGNYFGLTWSLNADLYSNFGLVSLLLGTSAIACLLARYTSKVAASTNVFLFVSYWLVLIYLPLLYRDGPAMFVYMVGFAMVAGLSLCKAGGATLQRLPVKFELLPVEPPVLHRNQDIKGTS